MLLSKAKYLSLMVLLGMGGCTTNQYVTRSGGGYDDLYGGNSGPALVAGRDAQEPLSRSNNPDYQQSYENTQGTADYYDESYLAANSVKRAVSSDVGYNAGFVDGYNQATRFSNPYGYNGFNSFGSYYPGSSLGLGFMFGLGSGFRMSPYLGYGMGGYGMGSMLSYGYSPWGYSSMMYDPWGYNSFGYSPWGYGGYSIFNSYYGGGYYGGNYGGAVVVVNNYERPGLTRSYGPRVTSSGSSRADRYNGNFVNTPRSNVDAGRSGRRSAESISGNNYDRGGRSSRNSGGYSSGRMAADAGGNTRSTARSYNAVPSDANNTYYSRPRSSSGYSSADGSNTGYYSSPRAMRSSSSYNSPSSSAPAYSAPARSQSNYSTTAPSRSNGSYGSPSRSEYSSPGRSADSYSSPSRSNNSYSSPAPSYSAPARSSYSAPSGGGSSGGGGGGHSSSRGPR
jgi:hypothetical protein